MQAAAAQAGRKGACMLRLYTMPPQGCSAHLSSTHLHVAGINLAHHCLPHALQVQGGNLLGAGVPAGQDRRPGRHGC